MIDIHQQKMATALTIAIQILVVAGLVACIIVGPQGWPSPVVSSPDAAWRTEYRPENTSAVAYPIVGHQPPGGSVSILSEAGGTDRPGPGYYLPSGALLSCSYPIMICTAVGYLPMIA